MKFDYKIWMIGTKSSIIIVNCVLINIPRIVIYNFFSNEQIMP